jgi:hypothetical protein
MYHFNRFFLLFSICLSFLIPFFTIETAPEVLVLNSGNTAPYSVERFNEVLTISEQIELSSKPAFNWMILLCITYFSISGLLIIKFVRSVYLIFRNISKNKTVSYKGETLVLLEEDSLPY